MTHIPRLWCFCGGEMFNKKMGVRLEAVITAANTPYYKISADLYACKDCDNQVFVPAQQPLISHYQEGYDEQETNYEVRL